MRGEHGDFKCKRLLAMLISLFGSFILLAIVVSGLALIVAPEKGRELTKNAAVSIGMIVCGLALLQTCCASLHC